MINCINKKINIILLVSILIISLGIVSCESETNTVDINNEPLVVDLVEDYHAVGNGLVSDRSKIQQAINDVSLAGGGTVIFTKNHTFLSGNLILRSNVKLYIDDNATILQNPDILDYIEVRGYDYQDGKGFIEIGEHYTPYTDDVNMTKEGIYATIWPGCNDYLEAWHWNYPFLYADNGTENIIITGGTNSKIQMAVHGNSCQNNIHMNVIGFYRVNNFEISNLNIPYTGNHLMDYICCSNGLINNLECTTKRGLGESECRMNDGLHLDRCQNILVQDCYFASGDDSCKLGNSYGDVRRDRWASSTDMMMMENIEISHVTCPGLCSGFAFMSLAGTCPELEEVQMRDIYIHDCNFAGVKIWGQNTVWLPDYSMWNSISVPITNLRFENNNVNYHEDGHPYQIQGILNIEPMSDCISDNPLMRSMTTLLNGDFSLGSSYWCFKTTNNSTACVEKYDDKSYGFIGNLDEGITRIYEGLYLDKGTYKLSLNYKNSNDAKVYVFISDQADNIIKKLDINSSIWTSVSFEFEISEQMNYRIGISSAESSGVLSWMMFDDVQLIKK